MFELLRHIASAVRRKLFQTLRQRNSRVYQWENATPAPHVGQALQTFERLSQ